MTKNVMKLVEIYMKEYRKKIKKYEIINYYHYKYYHAVDVKYKYKNDTFILTIELNITSDKTFKDVIKYNSIKKFII